MIWIFKCRKVCLLDIEFSVGRYLYWISILKCRNVRVLDYRFRTVGSDVYWITILNCRKVRVLDINIELYEGMCTGY